jgi:hypothetical protein
VLAAELRVYPLALALVASGKSNLAQGKVYNAVGSPATASLIVPDPAGFA